MLYREIIAVCSQIHTKHINTLCGQNVELLNVNPLNAKLNPICHLLSLLGVHHILHISRIRVKLGGTYSEFKTGVSSLGYVALDNIWISFMCDKSYRIFYTAVYTIYCDIYTCGPQTGPQNLDVALHHIRWAPFFQRLLETTLTQQDGQSLPISHHICIICTLILSCHFILRFRSVRISLYLS